VCGRASESTIIGLIIPESATRIVTTFDICRFQGVTALALTTLWKPWFLPLIKDTELFQHLFTSNIILSFKIRDKVAELSILARTACIMQHVKREGGYPWYTTLGTSCNKKVQACYHTDVL
jgi:hypothetical protein